MRRLLLSFTILVLLSFGFSLLGANGVGDEDNNVGFRQISDGWRASVALAFAREGRKASLHVAEIEDLSGDKNRPSDSWAASFVVTVEDETGAPAGGVTVTCDWTGLHEADGTASEITDANGRAVFNSSSLPIAGKTTLTVTSLAKSRHAYDVRKNIANSRTASISVPWRPEIRAEDWLIAALDGHYAKVDSAAGTLIQLATDAAGNPAHAVGDFKFRFPGAIPDGKYRLTVRWRTGTMGGTPWAYLLGTEAGRVTEHGIPSGRWHYFYPGHSGSDSDRWFAHDLAGSNPVDFSMWPNSPVSTEITISSIGRQNVSGVGQGDFYIRLRDMSPGENNSFSIESIALTPIGETATTLNLSDGSRLPSARTEENLSATTAASAAPRKEDRPAAASFPLAPIGDEFTIGVYYAMPWLEPKDNFSWDYAFMDMARSGCNFVVISGNCWANQWAAIKQWGMTGVTSYNQLIAYPGPGKWKPSDFVAGIEEQRERLKSFVWNGEHVGDAVVGHIMDDEPECRGLTEDEKDYLRAWADVYHRQNPARDAYVNHCDPEWYDLNEKHATCSAAPTIAVNSARIRDRIKAARSIGLKNFTVVALLGRMSDWSGNKADMIEYWNLGRATPEVFDWLASRTNYQDAYEGMITAYCYGATGFHPYIYNQHRGYSLVDKEGNGQYGIRTGFSDAAHDLRRSHGWPGVTLSSNSSPIRDRGTYPAGHFTLTAQAVSDSGTIEKVVFGKSSDGGSTWQTDEDATAPYSATFSTDPETTVIFRARAVAADGKKSIYAANMIHISNDAQP